MDTVKFVMNDNEIMRLDIGSGFDIYLDSIIYVYGEEYAVANILREGHIHTARLINKDTYDRLKLVGEKECIIPKSEYEDLIAQVEELKEKLKKSVNVNINFESLNVRGQDDTEKLANEIATLLKYELGRI